MNELTVIDRKQMYVGSVRSLVSGVLALNFEVWAAEDTPVLKSVSRKADGVGLRGLVYPEDFNVGRSASLSRLHGSWSLTSPQQYRHMLHIVQCEIYSHRRHD